MTVADTFVGDIFVVGVVKSTSDMSLVVAVLVVVVILIDMV